jgi:formate/nitrite transporter FocA (FNT family)
MQHHSMLSGGDVSWLSFFKDNLLPVTLGNIVGGAGTAHYAYNTHFIISACALVCVYSYYHL